jgi:hypothetical protein
MSSMDARFLSPQAQETLRSRVMAALRGGMKPAVAARTCGVSRSSVWNWRKRVALGNSTSLKSKKRGRPNPPYYNRSKPARAANILDGFRSPPIQNPKSNPGAPGQNGLRAKPALCLRAFSPPYSVNAA